MCLTKASPMGSVPSFTCRIWYMRPRGESISRPSVLYVGQWFRHSPQCTQVESSSQVGWSGPANSGDISPVPRTVSTVVCSDNESSPVENVFWIKRALDRQHHFDIGRRGAPNVKVIFGFFGTIRHLGRRSLRQERAKCRDAVGILHGRGWINRKGNECQHQISCSRPADHRRKEVVLRCRALQRLDSGTNVLNGQVRVDDERILVPREHVAVKVRNPRPLLCFCGTF